MGNLHKGYSSENLMDNNLNNETDDPTDDMTPAFNKLKQVETG